MPKNAKSRAQGKKKANKPHPRPARSMPASGPMSTATGLSHCSDDYAKSLVQPWGPEAPCLPSGFPLPSLKRKFFARGTFGQGTTTGFIIFNPLKGISSDEDCIYYTTGAFVGTDMSSTVGAGLLAARLNSSYSYAQMGVNDGLRVRVVSAGIRVRYDGTELNRAGRIIPIEHPTHSSLTTFNVTDILAMQGITPVRPSSDGKWVTVVSSGPKQAVELSYATDPNANAQGAWPYLGVMVNGGVAPTAGTANYVLEFECWANYEIVGTNLSGQTISHHDPIGASLAANAVSTAQMSAPHSNSPGFFSTVTGLIGKYGREAVTDSSKFLWNNRSTIVKGIGDVAMML